MKICQINEGCFESNLFSILREINDALRFDWWLLFNDLIFQITAFLFFGSIITFLISWRMSVRERIFYGVTFEEWKKAGIREMGSAGVIVPLLSTIAIVMASMFFGYAKLSTDIKSRWDYLSFAAPSIGAILGVGAFVRDSPWLDEHLISDSAFFWLLISLMTIPLGYIGYLISHPVDGLWLWNIKSLLASMWLPISIRVIWDIRRNRPSDNVFILGSVLGGLTSEFLIYAI